MGSLRRGCLDHVIIYVRNALAGYRHDDRGASDVEGRHVGPRSRFGERQVLTGGGVIVMLFLLRAGDFVVLTDPSQHTPAMTA
jgi:hypothetical protein